MRQLRHLLRLHHDGVSVREIGRRLGVARSTIQDNLKRAAAAGLAWPLADGVTDEALERQLFGRAGVTQGQRRRVGPDWAALARELKRPGVTMTILWEEYRALGLDTSACDLAQCCATAGAIAATVEKANSALTLLGFEASLSSNDIKASGDQFGSGYGFSTPAMVEAVRLMARREGLLLDPVYGGKAFAGLLADISGDNIRPAATSSLS